MKKFSQTSIPKKRDLLRSLKKSLGRKSEKTISGKYQYSFVRSNTVLLANVFENFLNIFLEIYELDPAPFLTAPGIAWQAALKKTKFKL